MSDPNRGEPANGAAGRPPRLLPIGKFFGVPLYFAPSWVLIAALITVLYNSIIYDAVDGISHSTSYLVAFGFAVALAICVLAHELGHVAVSLALHRPVRRVVIFLLGGVSEIEHDIDRPRDEFLVSLAGPVVSLAIAGAAALAYHASTDNSIPSVLFALLMFSNLVVAIFNMLPGLPLDGGRVLRAAVWGASHSRLWGTRVAAWAGRAVAVLVMVPSVLVHSSGWSFGTALFGLALGVFIWVGATQSLNIAELQERLPQLNLAALLRPGLFVSPDTSVAEALRQSWSTGTGGLVVIDQSGHPQAVVDEHRIGAIPVPQRPWTQVSAVARTLEPGMILPVTLTGEALLDAVRETPASEYLVVNENGSAAGLLAAIDLAAALSGRRA